MEAVQVTVVKQQGGVVVVLVVLAEERPSRRLQLALVFRWQVAQDVLGRLGLLVLRGVIARVLLLLRVNIRFVLVFLLGDLQVEALQRRRLAL